MNTKGQKLLHKADPAKFPKLEELELENIAKRINGDAKLASFSTLLKLTNVKHVAIQGLGKKKLNSDLFFHHE
jgi:hypothetical protein